MLHGAADGEWRGQAAIAFRDLLDDDVRPKIDKCVEAFDDAHSALSTWSTSLDGYQSRAANCEKWAAEAQADADAARAVLSDLPAKPAPGAPAPEDDRRESPYWGARSCAASGQSNGSRARRPTLLR
ncbi:MAG: putative integral rane protein [Aeromicrobium sp.]|nr:putative integral rane protein [Aeromicrobium sp.]